MILHNFIIIIIIIIIINFCLSSDLRFSHFSSLIFEDMIRNGYVLVMRKLFPNIKLWCS